MHTFLYLIVIQPAGCDIIKLQVQIARPYRKCAIRGRSLAQLHYTAHQLNIKKPVTISGWLWLHWRTLQTRKCDSIGFAIAEIPNFISFLRRRIFPASQRERPRADTSHLFGRRRQGCGIRYRCMRGKPNFAHVFRIDILKHRMCASACLRHEFDYP